MSVAKDKARDLQARYSFSSIPSRTMDDESVFGVYFDETGMPLPTL